jgi:hypothetical protein
MDGEEPPPHEPRSPKGHFGRSGDFERWLSAAHVLTNRSKLGWFSGPFEIDYSQQLKNTIRDVFPDDKDTFDEADREERSATALMFRMRLLTFAVFGAFSAFAFWFALNGFSTGLLGRAPDPIYSSVLFVLAAAAAWVVRWQIRHEYFGAIERDASGYATTFFTAISALHDLSVNAFGSSRQDHQGETTWPDRSAGWTQIGLWFGRRYENVDRYITAVAWRLQWRSTAIEIAFMLLKAVTAGAVVAFGAYSLLASAPSRPSTIEGLVALGAYVAITIVGWGFSGRRSNAYWSERFTARVVGFDDMKEHVHDQIANVVRADKKAFLGTQRSIGRTGAGHT